MHNHSFSLDELIAAQDEIVQVSRSFEVSTTIDITAHRAGSVLFGGNCDKTPSKLPMERLPMGTTTLGTLAEMYKSEVTSKFTAYCRQ